MKMCKIKNLDFEPRVQLDSAPSEFHVDNAA